MGIGNRWCRHFRFIIICITHCTGHTAAIHTLNVPDDAGLGSNNVLDAVAAVDEAKPKVKHRNH